MNAIASALTAFAVGIALVTLSLMLAVMLAEMGDLMYNFPHEYCMCDKDWEPNQTEMIKTMYGGLGGTERYNRPTVCVYWC